MPEIAAVEEGAAGIKTEELTMQLRDRDWFHACIKSRDDRVIFHVKASKDLGDDLRVGER